MPDQNPPAPGPGGDPRERNDPLSRQSPPDHPGEPAGERTVWDLSDEEFQDYIEGQIQDYDAEEYEPDPDDDLDPDPPEPDPDDDLYLDPPEPDPDDLTEQEQADIDNYITGMGGDEYD